MDKAEKKHNYGASGSNKQPQTLQLPSTARLTAINPFGSWFLFLGQEPDTYPHSNQGLSFALLYLSLPVYKNFQVAFHCIYTHAATARVIYIGIKKWNLNLNLNVLYTYIYI